MKNDKVIKYLTFNDVLMKCGITDLDRVLLMRHSLGKDNFKKCYLSSTLHRDDTIRTYTSCQKKDFEGKYDYWAVFISGKGTTAKLYRIYKVGKCVKATPDMQPEFYPVDSDFNNNEESYIYDLTEFNKISEYNNRLVIDWGKAARKWYQIAGNNPKIIESLMNTEKREFPGYENVILDYYELLDMVDDSICYEAWHAALSAIYAIYIIVDTKTGNQYIGSATGAHGLFGRWSDYAYTHDGGDKLLIELLKKSPSAYEHFRFSILRVLPKTMTKDQVIAIESQYKEKLGSRIFGLNAN